MDSKYSATMMLSFSTTRIDIRDIWLEARDRLWRAGGGVGG